MPKTLLMKLGDSHGQASLEYGLILVAFLATIAALAAIWTATKHGTLTDLALDSASHLVSGGILQTFQDILLY